MSEPLALVLSLKAGFSLIANSQMTPSLLASYITSQYGVNLN